MNTSPISSIHEQQEAIIQAFQVLEGDREAMLYYIMELGEQMSPLSDAHKTEANIIKGCMSSVWLKHHQVDGRIFFEADSNTAITKGLISLLVRVLSGQTAQDIVPSELYFIERIGMHQLIGSQRSSGLFSMIQQMKLIAAQQLSKA